jgi:hypothetical protein
MCIGPKGPCESIKQKLHVDDARLCHKTNRKPIGSCKREGSLLIDGTPKLVAVKASGGHDHGGFSFLLLGAGLWPKLADQIREMVQILLKLAP